MDEKKTQTTIIDEDEIDLYDLYLVIKKRARLIGIIFLLITISSGIISFILPPVYSGKMLIRLPNIYKTIITPSEAESILSELDELREEDRFDELSKKLNMDKTRVSELVKISTSTPRGEKKFIEATIEVYKPEIIIPIKNALIEYLNNNKYVKERIRLQRESMNHLKEEIQKKINEIEGLKEYVVKEIKEGKVKDLGFNPIGLDKEVINLKQRLKNIEKDITLLKGFEVVVEPNIPVRPSKPRKKLIVAVAGFTSIFFGIFLAFFMEWVEKNKRDSK